MDHTNHWYGHAHILAEYCGLDPDAPPPIRGVLQHGWTFVHGYGANHVPDPSLTKLVWSDVVRRRAHLLGWRDLAVIGAPFAYLEAMTPAPETAAEGTIWYPFHGTREYEQVEGDHGRLVDTIRATETGPVTVCLYYVEYEDPAVRREYEAAGFRVICHGYRGANRVGTDRQFLVRQLAELRRHRRVASNRLSTAVLYGASLGREAVVYGDPMTFQDGKPGFVDNGLLDALYPEFFGTATDPAVTTPIARAEIGSDRLVDPDELGYLLGWKEPWLASSN